MDDQHMKKSKEEEIVVADGVDGTATMTTSNTNKKKAAVSWTGGKDCHLAFWETSKDPLMEITCLVCFRLEGMNQFHAHPIPFMKAQANAIGLPLYFVNISKDCTDYKEAYVNGMKELKSNYGIDVIVTGDMDYVGDMKRNWIEECGEEANIQAHLPLWMANREECLHKLVNEQFDVIFTCVKSPWFTSKWIGRSLTFETIQELKEMSKETDPLNVHSSGLYKPLDLGGERGEYHTMCLNAPFYQRRISDAIAFNKDPKELKDQLSMKLSEERWWAISLLQENEQESSQTE